MFHSVKWEQSESFTRTTKYFGLLALQLKLFDLMRRYVCMYVCMYVSTEQWKMHREDCNISFVGSVVAFVGVNIKNINNKPLTSKKHVLLLRSSSFNHVIRPSIIVMIVDDGSLIVVFLHYCEVQ